MIMKLRNKWLALALACALLAGCGADRNTGSGSVSTDGSGTVSSAQTSDGSQSGDASASGGSSEAGSSTQDQEGGGASEPPEQPQQPEDGSQQPEPPQGGDGTDQPYDFTQPAPETPKVDDSYFSDAAFVICNSNNCKGGDHRANKSSNSDRIPAKKASDSEHDCQRSTKRRAG